MKLPVARLGARISRIRPPASRMSSSEASKHHHAPGNRPAKHNANGEAAEHRPNNGHPKHQGGNNQHPAASKSSVDHGGGGGAYTADEYTRNPDHVARTDGAADEESYVLTLLTDPAHHKRMTAIRSLYFPAKINKLEAHIALFRALPGSQKERVVQDLQSVCAAHKAFAITADKPFRLGHGVAIGLRRGEGTQTADGIFRELRGRWESFLSKQDRGGFSAHYTVQNKVDDDETVQKTLHELKRDFKHSDGTVTGLALYRYHKGYWKDMQPFHFPKDGAS